MTYTCHDITVLEYLTTHLILFQTHIIFNAQHLCALGCAGPRAKDPVMHVMSMTCPCADLATTLQAKYMMEAAAIWTASSSAT